MSIERELLGCQWGRVVTTPDDKLECDRKAERYVVLHDGDAEVALKLCAHHVERISQETTPRVEHQTSFQPLGIGRYVPVCSCGFRGATVGSAVAAIYMANAHAREAWAEPKFPQTHQRVAGQEDDLP